MPRFRKVRLWRKIAEFPTDMQQRMDFSEKKHSYLLHSKEKTANVTKLGQSCVTRFYFERMARKREMLHNFASIYILYIYLHTYYFFKSAKLIYNTFVTFYGFFGFYSCCKCVTKL